MTEFAPEIHLIPEAEQHIAPTGEEAATRYAVEYWVVPNDQPQTILYESLIEGYDFQIEFFCREIVHRRTVFVNATEGGYVAAAWCDSPPNLWSGRITLKQSGSTSNGE